MPKADRLSPGAVKLLQEPNLAHVATLMPSGAPQITITWIDVEPDGGHVLVNTGTKRVKLDNVRRDPRVAISVVDPKDPWRYVYVRGKVVDVTQEGGAEHIEKLSQKYTGRAYRGDVSGDPRWIWKVKPTSVVESRVT